MLILGLYEIVLLRALKIEAIIGKFVNTFDHE